MSGPQWPDSHKLLSDIPGTIHRGRDVRGGSPVAGARPRPFAVYVAASPMSIARRHRVRRVGACAGVRGVPEAEGVRTVASRPGRRVAQDEHREIVALHGIAAKLLNGIEDALEKPRRWQFAIGLQARHETLF